MKYDVCMKRECKNCIYETRGFEKKDEYSKNKYTKAKTIRI